jgi:excisionase family DNA binding protein
MAASKTIKGTASLVSDNQRARLVADGFVSVPEAAKFLGLSRSKIYLLMDSCELPFSKFGKSRRIPRRALSEFAAKSLVGLGVEGATGG